MILKNRKVTKNSKDGQEIWKLEGLTVDIQLDDRELTRQYAANHAWIAWQKVLRENHLLGPDALDEVRKGITLSEIDALANNGSRGRPSLATQAATLSEEDRAEAMELQIKLKKLGINV